METYSQATTNKWASKLWRGISLMTSSVQLRFLWMRQKTPLGMLIISLDRKRLEAKETGEETIKIWIPP